MSYPGDYFLCKTSNLPAIYQIMLCSPWTFSQLFHRFCEKLSPQILCPEKPSKPNLVEHIEQVITFDRIRNKRKNEYNKNNKA